jgi:D-alanine-D-alanine ligase
MLTVLHLVGSCESERLYNVSMLYSSACENNGEFNFVFAVISPDKLWSFTRRLDEGAIPEVDTSLPQQVPLHIAITYIMTELKPDVAINHMYCQLGSVNCRGLMELLDIPVVGSNSSVQQITKDKVITRALLVQGGVQMPKAIVLNQHQFKFLGLSSITDKVEHKIGFPCVVKAPCVDDSTGVFYVTQAHELKHACEKALDRGNKIVIEQFIAGREVRSAIFQRGNGQIQVLPIIEYGVNPNQIRDSSLKLEYEGNGTARKSKKTVWFFIQDSNGEALNDVITKNVQEASKAAYQILDLQDFGIFDFRVGANGEAYLLEVNLYCSFGAESFLNLCSTEAGYGNKDLLKAVLERASNRN